MNPWIDRLRRWWPALLVTVFGLVLLWPIPAGQMPLSADHTVHLTRAYLYAEQLAAFDLRGWSPVWFFGTPIGELYPVLGDMLIAALRVVSLGLLDWPQAYAVGFTLVYIAQGWVLLRAGRRMGWGPLPGLVAAALVMADVGSYREGGWIYVVFYGVWPQTLATSLTWLGFAELAHAIETAEAEPKQLGRRIAIAAASLGAALLAHPMSMATIAVGGPLCVLTLGGLNRERLRRAAAVGILVATLALGIAAWWLLPMLGHRGWMASYGWLWLDLETMFGRATSGQWCQSMPSSVGYAIWAGLIVVAIGGRRSARFFAVTAIVLWVLASRDVMWSLRLDLVSEGFTHLQWQRFITAAKPGLFLMAGAAVGGLGKLALWSWEALVPRLRLVVTGVATLAALAAAVTMARETQAEYGKLPPEIRDVQRVRLPGPGYESLDADHAALAAWLDEQWTGHDGFWRVTVRESRNLHWFMDLPVLAEGVPILKQGFTPGDNFVHKPEKAPGKLQELAQVRYEIRRGQRAPRNATVSFGSVHVVERPNWEAAAGARLEGPGTVELLEQDFERGVVRVRVGGTGGPTRLVFGVAGFPRWHLQGPDGPVQWYEAPVVGDGATVTQTQRFDGELRGGKAHGDDGTEPTLIAADVTDGEYTLRYRGWRFRDLLGLGLSALAIGFCVSIGGWPRKTALGPDTVTGIRLRLGIAGHPIVLLALLAAALALGAIRYGRGRSAEAVQASGWVLDGRAAALTHARTDYLKTDMLIRPAVVFDRRHAKPAVVAFEGIELPPVLDGWVALDDDDAKVRRRGSVRFSVEVRTGDGDWTPLFDQTLEHAPGQLPLSLDTGELAGQRADLRIVAQAEGKAPPQVGFDVEIGGAR